ncbi:unnamed protein product, partial [Prorocentrum cordatum]
GGAGGGGHGAAAPDASRRSPISPMVIRRAAAASPRLGVGASGAEGERQGGWARLSPIRPAATDHAESSTRRRLAVRRPRRRRAPLRSEAVNKDCQHREKLRPEPRRSQGEDPFMRRRRSRRRRGRLRPSEKPSTAEEGVRRPGLRSWRWCALSPGPAHGLGTPGAFRARRPQARAAAPWPPSPQPWACTWLGTLHSFWMYLFTRDSLTRRRNLRAWEKRKKT